MFQATTNGLNLFSQIQKRTHSASPFAFCASAALTKRLDIETTLKGHNNSINSVQWSSQGDFLLSGSSDHTVQLWDVSRRPRQIDVGSGEIHCAKFLDQETIIVSGYDIRILNITNGSKRLLTGHQLSIRDIGLDSRTPSVFLTAGEDGTVRQYDLREKPRSGQANYEGSLLIDLRQQRRHNFRSENGIFVSMFVNTQTKLAKVCLNPSDSNELTASGADPVIRIYDRRMINNKSNESVRKIVPSTISNSSFFQQMVVSGISYNHDGSKLLASYRGENLYTVNTKGQLPSEPATMPDLRPTKPSIDPPNRATFEAPIETELPMETEGSSTTGTSRGNKTFRDEQSTESEPPAKRSRPLETAQSSNPELTINQTPTTTQPTDIEMQEDRTERTETNPFPDDEDMFHRLRRVLRNIQSDTPNQTTTTHPTANAANLGNLLGGMILGGLLMGGMGVPEPTTTTTTTEQERSPVGPRVTQTMNQPSQTQPAQPTGEEGGGGGGGGGGGMQGILSGILSGLMGRRQDLHPTQTNQTETPNNGSPEGFFTNQTRGANNQQNQSTIPNSTEFIDCYTGHHNSSSLSAVCFFGPNSEYCVSGSDGGKLFVWDTRTGKIVTILNKADQNVTSTLSAHPHTLMLASGGSDQTVKLWSPCGEKAMEQDEIDRITAANEAQGNDHQNIFGGMGPLLINIFHVEPRRNQEGGGRGVGAGAGAGPGAGGDVQRHVVDPELSRAVRRQLGIFGIGGEESDSSESEEQELD